MGICIDFFNFFCIVAIFVISFMWHIPLCEGYGTEYVTCGTIMKLINSDLRLRLHSHDVKYGSGSGQQSVTAVDVSDDYNSHWQILAPTSESCKRGTPIKCGSNIRLQHVGTKKNLHSHHFSSPLSNNQEVSCYGDSEGVGDTGDHWTVVCNNDFWRRDTPVKFRHIDTGAYLAGSGRTFGRPINGQGEVVGVSSQYGAYTDWQAKEGLFVHPSDPLPNAHAIHTEL